MSQIEVEQYTRSVTYPRTREVIAAWRDAGLEVLHLGHLARDSYRPPEVYGFNDVTPMIRDSDLGRFRQVMDSAGYSLIQEDPHSGRVSAISRELADKLMAKPWGCTASYARETKGPVAFWVNVVTSRRAGQLFLVDLDHWFSSPDLRTVTVMGDTEIQCAPTWAHMLYEVANVFDQAARHRVERAKRHIGYAYLLASQPNIDWDLVRKMILRYEAEHVARYSRYLASLGPAAQPAAELDRRFGLLGIRCKLGYCFQAIEDYYPGTIPQTILDICRNAPDGPFRRVWFAPDPDHEDRYRESYQGGVHAVVRFSIHTQLERYGHLTNEQLFSQKLVIDPLPITDVFADATEETISRLYAK